MKKIILLWLVVLTGSLFAQSNKTPEIVVPTIKGSDDYKATYYEEGKTYATEEWLETYMQYYHSNTDTSLHLLAPIDLFASLRGKAEEQQAAQLYFDLRNTLVFKEGTREDVIENFLSETEATRPMSARKYKADLTQAQLLFAGMVFPNNIENPKAVPFVIEWSRPFMKLVNYINISDRNRRPIANLSRNEGGSNGTISDYDASFCYWEIGMKSGKIYKFKYEYKDPTLGPPIKRMKPPINPVLPPAPPSDPSISYIPQLDEDCNILPKYYNNPITSSPYISTFEFVNPEPYEYITVNEVIDVIDQGNGQFLEIYGPVIQAVSNKYTTSINRGVYGSFGEIRTAVYLNPYHEKVTKPFIVTDGIDFLSNRGLDEIVKEFGGNDMISLLWDGGYDVIIADFAGGADFIQRNAFAFIELLRSLRQDQGIEEIEAAVGPSMGGQIIRYALMYWEKNLVSQYGNHNMKTFVSADSPWSGANASPGIQAFADFYRDNGGTPLLIHLSANAPAARQLLLHHTFNNTSNDVYSPGQHPFKTAFDSELVSLGSKPTQVKKIIAIADGSGTGQSSNVSPGGEIMSFNYETDNPIYYSECYLESIINGIDNSTFIVDRYKDILFGSGFSCRSAYNKLPKIFSLQPINTFDSCPGSPFNLKRYLTGINEGDVVYNERGFKLKLKKLDIQNTFSFIPTFSALGMSTENVYLNFFNNSIPSGAGYVLPGSPFDAVYFDNTDSEHNALTNIQQPGSILFLLDEIKYHPEFNSKCLILDEIGIGTESIVFYSDQPNNQNFCIPFEITSANALSSPGCGAELLFNGEEIEITTNGDEEPCTTILTYCMDVPGCGQVCNDVEIIVSPGSSNKLAGEQGAAVTTTGVQELNSKMYMYPNPSSGLVNVDIYNEQDYGLVYIYNVYGREVTALRTQQKLDLSFLSNGVYSLVFKNKSYQKVFEQKLIIIK